MKLKKLFVVVPAMLLTFGGGAASAGQTINEVGAVACVIDKWDEKEPEKGHKLVDMTSRCVIIPDDPAEPKYPQDCVGKYEFMPDESWKSSGTCTNTYAGGGTTSITWEEGSHLKDYPYNTLAAGVSMKVLAAAARTRTRI